MNDSLPIGELHCTQCGGELHPDEGQIFITCPYCSSTVYLDKSRVVFHWYLAPTLDEDKAQGYLARWMAGNSTVKDLDKKSKLLARSFAYFPMWHLKYRTDEGKEGSWLYPAAATSVTEIGQIRLPAGDLRKYDQSVEAQSQPPTVPLETSMHWFAQQGISKEQVIERSLVHIPLYFFKYSYQGDHYSAIVEGATGEVFANIYPAKAEAPYRLVASLAALTFLCLATFPIVGGIINSFEGFGLGLLICSGAGIILAPMLFALGVWVAAKI
jgi:DNA-directed RNA polymerase subunit RPC12/RpoP